MGGAVVSNNPAKRHQRVWRPSPQLERQTWVHVTPSPISKRQAWTSPAYAHATQELQQMAAQLDRLGEPKPTAAARFTLLDVLRDVLAADSVFPSLSSDGESGLLAEWRADNNLIEVHVTDDGEPLFRVRIRRGAVLYEGSSTVQLRRHLRNMTTLVNSVNPGWKTLFGQGLVVRPA